MEPFELKRAHSLDEALAAAANGASQGVPVRFLAGGTTLLDLMKLRVERPFRVIDISRLPLDRIEALPSGGVQIGALVRNADLAHHPLIQGGYPMLSQALLSGASAQLRNMATTGGNLLQRTRCVYFRDVASPCNKRVPGSGCAAQGGMNRNLAILGTSPHCIATNPSDMNVALSALDAQIHLVGPRGQRSVAIDDFFLLPGSTPERETVLEAGELITHVTLPPPGPDTHSLYLKLRDRASYEFALASAAVSLRQAAGRIVSARVALGGVGTKPWRAHAAEALLQGHAPDSVRLREAAAAALRGAQPASENGFKIELAQRCLVHALTLASIPARPPKDTLVGHRNRELQDDGQHNKA